MLLITKLLLRSSLVFALLSVSGIASAINEFPEDTVRIYISGDYSIGEKAVAVSTNPADTLDYGDVIGVNVGVEGYNDVSDWRVRLGAGYRTSYNDTSVTNKRFQTYTTELLLVNNAGLLEYGFGFVYHIDPRVRDVADYKNETGYIVHTGIRIGNNLMLTGRYTNIDYNAQLAEHISIGILFAF